MTIDEPPHPLQDLLETAVAAAQAAGDYALRERARAGEVHQQFAHDVKLKLDIESQAQALGVIHARYPDHDVLGEEDDHAAARTGSPTRLQWVIDPIDGTVNFFHGMPLWCSSVAVQQEGRTLAGAVYAPEAHELYTATATDVARVNGQPLRVSTVPDLAGALLLTGLSQKGAGDPVRASVIGRLAERVQKVRVMGSAALDMCRVARGHAEAYWEPAIYLWDMAAAGLIVERAGGRGEILARRAGHQLSFVASNGLVHEAVVQLLREEHGLPAPA